MKNKLKLFANSLIPNIPRKGLFKKHEKRGIETLMLIWQVMLWIEGQHQDIAPSYEVKNKKLLVGAVLKLSLDRWLKEYLRFHG